MKFAELCQEATVASRVFAGQAGDTRNRDGARVYYELFQKLQSLSDVILPDQRGLGMSSPNTECPRRGLRRLTCSQRNRALRPRLWLISCPRSSQTLWRSPGPRRAFRSGRTRPRPADASSVRFRTPEALGFGTPISWFTEATSRMKLFRKYLA